MPTGTNGASNGDPPERLGRAELDAFLVENLPLLRAFVRLNVDTELRARESCSDLVQSVCRQLLEHGEGVEFRDRKRLRSWLYTAVLNKIRDRHRFWDADRRRQPAPGATADQEMWDCYASVATPSEHAIARERAELVERAFDALPPQYREVITLSRCAALEHGEIAARLGKTEANVRMLLSRALARLSTLLEPAGGGRGD